MSDNLTFSGNYAFGIVESISDPLKIGRIQVRIFAIHSQDKTRLPTDNLPWCQLLLPVTENESASHGVKVGHCVRCSFLDGIEMQIPIIDGILPGIISNGENFLGLNDKTLSTYADGRGVVRKPTIHSTQSIDPYNALYPYNRVIETMSGHRIEIDDTPGSERVHIYHKSGSNVEFHPDGSLVTSINNNEEVFIKNNSVHWVGGNETIEIGKNCQVTIKGNASINSYGNLSLKSNSNISIVAGGILELNGSTILLG